MLTGHTAPVNSIAFSADGSTFASGSWDATIRLWDVTTGELRKTLAGHTGGVTSVTFRADGTTLASGSMDGTILLWDLE
jgi:WD40 repeat protein